MLYGPMSERVYPLGRRFLRLWSDPRENRSRTSIDRFRCDLFDVEVEDILVGNYCKLVGLFQAGRNGGTESVIECRGIENKAETADDERECQQSEQNCRPDREGTTATESLLSRGPYRWYLKIRYCRVGRRDSFRLCQLMLV